MGKRTSMEEFTKQNRGGKGVKCYKITEKTGNVVGMKAVDEDSEIMIINTEGIVIRMKCSDISQYGRITSGVKLINLPEHEKVASVAKVRKASAEIDGERYIDPKKNIGKVTDNRGMQRHSPVVFRCQKKGKYAKVTF